MSKACTQHALRHSVEALCFCMPAANLCTYGATVADRLAWSGTEGSVIQGSCKGPLHIASGSQADTSQDDFPVLQQ